jgi:esterase/lipase superfamily enzyme
MSGKKHLGGRSGVLNVDINIVRWGEVGQPVLLFPTAGGDAEEAERFLMIKALAPLLEAGRIKVYSVDSLAGRTWTDGDASGAWKVHVQNLFHRFLIEELVPRIHEDCGAAVECWTAGASIGAFNALSTICRSPDLFSRAICMSGTYDLTRWMNGGHGFDFHIASPLHFLPGLPEGHPQLDKLRTRFIVLPTGEGRWEAPWESFWVAKALGDKGIPNRVDKWGKDHDHDWVTWRAMLPLYLDDYTRP